MELLRCENITKTYGSGAAQVTALSHLNLSIHKGEFVAIVGTSGSGKSTLLHMLGGVDRPTEGHIYIEDTDISALSEEELAVFRRRKVGLIYQFYNLIPTLNVRKNILLPMLLDNRRPDEARFREIVETLGLADRLTHLPGELSGGQQQRVAIARSLIYRPALLLADEPTGNLDRKNSEETVALLKLSNQKYGQTVLLITHDENIALEAPRIITIEDGKILRDEVSGGAK
ncbi:MAG: ABC transporter ATP-binding protein [Oscillospiraceae bacterium]|jgi:putative ABC transport system ATP-binding protein|nr:ABC transporter ATP-binding protein [Oscillospiraceae bacterium]